jgi:hypothetical protein
MSLCGVLSAVSVVQESGKLAAAEMQSVEVLILCSLV